MKTEVNLIGAPRKAWTPPVLNQLTVDLNAIATGKPKTTDASAGAHTS